MRPLRPIVATLLAALLVVACSGGPGAAGSPSAPTPSTSAAPAPSTVASSAPTSGNAGSGGGVGGNAGGGGAVGGNPGSGVTPIPLGPGGPGQTPGPAASPSPSDVHPIAGLLDIHDVRATELRASSGDHLIVKVYWWSGPPPCSQLAEVKVQRTGNTFTLTVREGAVQLGVACAALAMYKVTSVDLGPVSPGTYDINALGVDPGIMVIYAS